MIRVILLSFIIIVTMLNSCCLNNNNNVSEDKTSSVVLRKTPCQNEMNLKKTIVYYDDVQQLYKQEYNNNSSNITEIKHIKRNSSKKYKKKTVASVDKIYNWCSHHAKPNVPKKTIVKIIKTTMKYPKWKLLLAIIATESNFDPKSVSKRAYGLMQIKYPIWKKHFDLKSSQSMFVIENNVKYGHAIFDIYLQETNSVPLALNKYAGQGKRGKYKHKVMSKMVSLNNFLNDKKKVIN